MAVHTVVRMPFAPPSTLGLSSGSGSVLGSDLTSAAASAPTLPPSSAPIPLPLPSSATALAPPPPEAVTPPTSPQRSQHTARQLERNRRVMGSPENRRTPAVPTLPPIQPPTLNGRQYAHLNADLAARVAALTPLPILSRRARRSTAAATSAVSITC